VEIKEQEEIDTLDLERFIVLAKSQTYVGGSAFSYPCRPASNDVVFQKGRWSYLDSYFGGTDFIGQEVVWNSGNPVWAMNYYGRILLPDLIDADRAGAIIKESLSELYKEGRFLGGFCKETSHGNYVDVSEGDVNSFIGTEKILVDCLEAYRLDYNGGLVKS